MGSASFFFCLYARDSTSTHKQEKETWRFKKNFQLHLTTIVNFVFNIEF